ncbi:MAG: hypothetical protein L6437_04525 [Kiritimatiellae bacterium]|nr:hypothetical protein [Kiritimatiellia bacterium]
MEINSVSKRGPNTSSQAAAIAMAGFLTDREAQYTAYALDELRKVQWATSLISKVETNGGINKVMPSLRFEVRYAYALRRQNIEAQYEYHAGNGDSSVDFRCIGKHEWLIELVSILPSEAGQQAIRDFNPGGKFPDGIEAYEQTLATNAENPKMSEEGEIILAQQKIGEKVFSNGQPTKFPVPTNSFHVIVDDMRGMFGIGGACAQDCDDYLEIAYGAKCLAQRDLPFHRWPTSNGQPIVGLFEQGNPLQSTKYVQERIHFVDFVYEEQYEENEIIERTFWAANPFLLSKDKGHNVRNSHPLYRQNTCGETARCRGGYDVAAGGD